MSSNSSEQSGSLSDLKHDEAVISSPGALLRNKRLALNLNEWDIARQMRLQMQYILDLEADNFDAFSSLAFVRGYLRGYAKIVGLSEMEVMQLFNQLALQDKSPATTVPKYITRGKSHSDRYWRWMGLVVLGFVAISLILWWENYNSSFKTINTSVNNTLQKVSALQNTLNAQTQNSQTQPQAVTPTPNTDPINTTLGASGSLLDSSIQPAAPSQTNMATPAATSANNTTVSTPAPNNTMAPVTSSNTAVTIPQPLNEATASTAPTVSSPTTSNIPAAATTPTPSKRKSRSSLNTAHNPTVDGQAPRFDSTN